MHPLIVTTPGQVGELLRGRRRALGLSQQQLASKLGITQSRLSTLEGDPAALTVERLLSLANLLGFELVLQEKSKTRTKAEW